MILENQKEAQVLNDGETGESIKMSLDLDSAQVLMQMLSKNLYSDAIGSTVRETASNALDSHRKAGVDTPIIVSLKVSTNSGYEYSVEDFGVGLDDTDVREIVSKYGSSTKRNNTEELGMYGLGFKAPLAYTSSFNFICRKNGMERKYMMYEGEDGNAIDLLYEAPTDQLNGVKIIIPVRYYDLSEFRNKIKEQLAYFENVYFDVMMDSYTSLSNDFTIFRGEDFQCSEMSKDCFMHICLDNVYYPLDFNKLGIKQIDIPLGLRFGLNDKIFPTPNRESVRYTEEAKDVIRKKICRVADYLVSKYNESVKDSDDIQKILHHYKYPTRAVTFINKIIEIGEILPFTTIKLADPKLSGVEKLDLKTLPRLYSFFLDEYRIMYTCKGGRFSENKKDKYIGLDVLLSEPERYFIFSERISTLKREYLKSQVSSSFHTTFFIKKTRNTKLFAKGDGYPPKDYVGILGLKSYKKDEWRQIIKDYQFIQSLILKNCKDADKIEISEAWLKKRKEKRTIYKDRRLKLQGEVNGKIACRLEKTTINNCKFVADTFEIDKFHKYPGLTIYGNHSEVSELDDLWDLRLRIISFSDRELKTVEQLNIHNLVNFRTFMKGENKTFKRFVTAFLIYDLMNKQRNVFSKVEWLEDISSSLYNKIRELKEYKSQNYRDVYHEVRSAMIEIATNNNLFDTTIYSTYLDVKNLLERLTFVDTILEHMPFYRNTSDNEHNQKMRDALCDLFKYHRYRIDYTNYHIKLAEEESETSLTEEEVKALSENQL